MRHVSCIILYHHHDVMWGVDVGCGSRLLFCTSSWYTRRCHIHQYPVWKQSAGLASAPKTAVLREVNIAHRSVEHCELSKSNPDSFVYTCDEPLKYYCRAFLAAHWHTVLLVIDALRWAPTCPVFCTQQQLQLSKTRCCLHGIRSPFHALLPGAVRRGCRIWPRFFGTAVRSSNELDLASYHRSGGDLRGTAEALCETQQPIKRTNA